MQKGMFFSWNNATPEYCFGWWLEGSPSGAVSKFVFKEGAVQELLIGVLVSDMVWYGLFLKERKFQSRPHLVFLRPIAYGLLLDLLGFV